MARVSISEAARLVKVSRPTIYKMINSGKLLQLCCKARKAIKVIDTSELIRVFGSLDGVIDTVKYDVKVTQNLQVLTALVYMIYNIESLYLKLKTMVLKAKARDEHIDSLRQAMQLLEHKREPSSPPHSPWWKFWKNPDPAMLEFSSPAIPGVPEPSQKSPDL